MQEAAYPSSKTSSTGGFSSFCSVRESFPFSVFFLSVLFSDFFFVFFSTLKSFAAPPDSCTGCFSCSPESVCPVFPSSFLFFDASSSFASIFMAVGSSSFCLPSTGSAVFSGVSASGFLSVSDVSSCVAVSTVPTGFSFAYATAVSGRMLPAMVAVHKVPANNLTTAFRFMDSSLLSLWVFFVLLYQNGPGLRNILFISTGSFIMLCDLCLYQSFLVI